MRFVVNILEDITAAIDGRLAFVEPCLLTFAGQYTYAIFRIHGQMMRQKLNTTHIMRLFGEIGGATLEGAGSKP